MDIADIGVGWTATVIVGSKSFGNLKSWHRESPPRDQIEQSTRSPDRVGLV